MGVLLVILGILFATLFVVVMLTQRFGKPMEPEQMQKLSRVAMILMGVLLVASAIKMLL